MIKDYKVTREMSIHGTVADIELGVVAGSVDSKDAILVAEEFDRFIARISGTKAPSRHSETRGLTWEDNEEDVIEKAPDWRTAWAEYQKQFPKSPRVKNAVRKKWWSMHPMGEVQKTNPLLQQAAPAEIPGTSPIPKEVVAVSEKTAPGKKKGNHAKNFDADRWTTEERQPVQDADNREDAIASYREKYPESTRSDDAIGRQFYELQPDKRSPEALWTDAENQPILTADSVEEAIAKYQELFPESKRTIPAIKREWYELRPEKRGEIPTGRKKGSTNNAPLKGTAREKYKIPFSTKQDQKGYNHAVYICTKYDKPYAEAVKLEAADLAAKKQKKAEKVVEVKQKPSKKAPG